LGSRVTEFGLRVLLGELRQRTVNAHCPSRPKCCARRLGGPSMDWPPKQKS